MLDEEKVEVMERSIDKNIRELCEFLVGIKIYNYYDLVDRIIHTHNFRYKVMVKDKKLWDEIEKELEEDERK